MDQELVHLHEAVFNASLESNERYHRLVAAMRDVVFTISPDGRFTSLNPAFETVTGWTCAEWLGKEFPLPTVGDSVTKCKQSADCWKGRRKTY
ncbi:PAS domain S-box protein [Nitrospira sp. Nam74]